MTRRAHWRQGVDAFPRVRWADGWVGDHSRHYDARGIGFELLVILDWRATVARRIVAVRCSAADGGGCWVPLEVTHDGVDGRTVAHAKRAAEMRVRRILADRALCAVARHLAWFHRNDDIPF